jgi:hypothetical protein
MHTKSVLYHNLWKLLAFTQAMLDAKVHYQCSQATECKFRNGQV